MRKIKFLFIILIVVSCRSQIVEDKFEIFGFASEPYQNTTLILATEKFVDTCVVRDGKFYFKGVVDKPTYAYLFDKYHNYNHRSFWLENNRIEFIDKQKTFVYSKIIGSQTQLEEDILQNRLKQLTDKYKSYVSSYLLNSERGEKFRDSIENILNNDKLLITDIRQNYIAEFPNSLVSLNQLDTFKNDWGKLKTTKLFNLMNKKSQSSKYGKSISSFIENRK